MCVPLQKLILTSRTSVCFSSVFNEIPHQFADGPQLTLVNKTVHGDNDTNASVVIEMVANPPIKNYTWTMNGNNLSNSSNVTVMPCGLYFTPLLADFMGNYSVQECNNISCSDLTFPLYVYCKLWVWLLGVAVGN